MHPHTIFRSLLVGMVALAASLPAPTMAGTVSVTAVGVITTGTDDGSLTGTPGSLVGKNVTLVQVMTGPATSFSPDLGTETTSSLGVFTTAALTITIGAFSPVTFSLPVPDQVFGSGTYALSNVPGNYSLNAQVNYGTDPYTELASTIAYNAASSFLANVNPLQAISLTSAPPGGTWFLSASYSIDVAGEATVQWEFIASGAGMRSITVVTAGFTAVPAPAGLGLLLISVATLSLVRRSAA